MHEEHALAGWQIWQSGMQRCRGQKASFRSMIEFSDGLDMDLFVKSLQIGVWSILPRRIAYYIETKMMGMRSRVIWLLPDMRGLIKTLVNLITTRGGGGGLNGGVETDRGVGGSVQR